MLKRTYRLGLVVLWGALTVLLLVWAMQTASAATPARAAQPVSDAAFADMLRKALRDNPDLVLDILRENSETILDIAQQGANQRRSKSLVTQWKADLAKPKNPVIKGRPVRGKADAPITIVAYSDFTCPYCEQAAGTIRKLLEEDKGNIRYVFKSFPLDAAGTARLAAEYYVAAGMQNADKAWAFYDKLFDLRDRLVNEGEPVLKAAAQEAGLDMKRLAADVKSKAVKSQIEEDIAEATRVGVQGTPYFLVNDIVVRGAIPAELFSTAISMALDAKKK